MIPKRKPITKSQRAVVWEKCGGHCAYCGRQICISEMQVDHVAPLELYEALTHGTDLQGTSPNCADNLLPACRSCNNYKSTLTVEKFRAMIERWPDVLMRDSVTYRNAVRFGLITAQPHKIEFYFEEIGVGVPLGLTDTRFGRKIRQERAALEESKSAP